MFSTDDTIVAIATPPGRGGIGVVRLSGPEAKPVALRLVESRRDTLRPRLATVARVRGAAGSGAGGGPDRAEAFDQVVCTFFPGPASYTGEDVVEISAHGSPVVLARIVEEAVRLGARLARPGEFTLRAHVNGRLDLVQAEAVADLVDAVTPAQARQAFDQLDGALSAAIFQFEHTVFELISRLEASLDFPDEGYRFVDAAALAADLAGLAARVAELLSSARRGRVIREGGYVAVVGRPNAGKSSLFNALLGASRAIVTTVPGTTRDLLTERCEIAGVPVTLADTAGLRDSADEVEREGIGRAKRAAATADVVLLVLDRSRPLSEEDRALAASLPASVIVGSKCDLAAAWDAAALQDAGGRLPLLTSARTGQGVDRLRDVIAERLGAADDLGDRPMVSNLRHVALLERARQALERASRAASDGASEEFVVADLRDAIQAFAEVTGERTTDDLLDAIFSRFCIGK